MGLASRFTLAMAGALALVGFGGGYLILRSTTVVAERHADELLSESVALTARARAEGFVGRDSKVERLEGGVTRQAGRVAGEVPARAYRAGQAPNAALLVVPEDRKSVGDLLFGLVLPIVAAMVLVGVGVAWWAAGQVTRPLQQIIKAVRQISIADPRYRGRVAGGGSEIASLSRALDRMSDEFEEAREAELELSTRDAEFDLAAEVREKLLPLATPLVEGLDLGAVHLVGSELDGAFHDFIELGSGKVGVLVGDVGASGLPAALIGASARAFLRSALGRGDEESLATALAEVNRELARDVLAGTWVSALYAVLDPAEGSATVACAGHRIPLLRVAASDGKLRVFQPGGLALGLDRGPVFERRLEVQKLELAPGDRLVLATSSAAALQSPDGGELGERGFYEIVHRHSRRGTGGFLKAVRHDLSEFQGEEVFPGDVSIVTVIREA
ncbi:MAG: SpoIIE family protein phosphatase [Planctomycetota bacterium]